MRYLSILLTLTLLFPAPYAAQVQAPREATETPEAAQQKLAERARALLDDAIAEAATLKLPENRALVQAMAGDLLWKADERRARSLFQGALADLALVRIKPNRRRERGEWMTHQARQQILLLVARRDPQAALDAVRSLRAGSGGDETSGGQEAESHRALEQSLSTQIAASDPKLALRLAEENLKKGVSYNVIGSLGSLQQKSPELAAGFVDTIVGKLRAENLSTNHEALGVAAYLMQMGTHNRGAFLSVGGESALSPTQPLGEEQRRELAQVIAAAATAAPVGSPVFHTLRQVMPEIEKYAPARAEQLRPKIAEFEQTLDPRQRAWNEYSSLMRSGKTEAMLEAAAKAPAEIRNALYNAAAWKLLEKGETERARKIITDNVRNADERKGMIEMIDRQILAREVAGGKIEEARRLLARTKDEQERAKGLATLASAALAKKDEKLARELLDEAYELVRGEAGSDEEVETQLQVARGYALVAPARSFEIIDSLVERANEMLTAAAILDKFGGGPQGLFREGEVVLTSTYVGVNSVFYRYVKEVKALARADFPRTKASLDAFKREELRTLARLLLAQGILTDDKDATRLPMGEEAMMMVDY